MFTPTHNNSLTLGWLVARRWRLRRRRRKPWKMSWI